MILLVLKQPVSEKIIFLLSFFYFDISHVQTLRLEGHMHKQAKILSGGTKRKLSFLLSMIGNANIVVLDEPSLGMDPRSRRSLWTIISANIKDNRCAILATNSMEEAEALCSRIGIMVDGKLTFTGTSKEIKWKYGHGYQLEVKFKLAEGDDVEERKKKYVFLNCLLLSEVVLYTKTR